MPDDSIDESFHIGSLRTEMTTLVSTLPIGSQSIHYRNETGAIEQLISR